MKWLLRSGMFAFLFALLSFSASIRAHALPSLSFGDGSDGDLTVSSGQTLYTDTVRTSLTVNAPATSTALAVGNTIGFTASDEILIYSPQGTYAGTYRFAVVTAVAVGQLTLETPTDVEFRADGANRTQVIRVPNYSNLTVSTGGLVTANAWDGSTGGVLAFRVSGSLTVETSGIIRADSKGFRGAPTNYGIAGLQGESTTGSGGASTSANGTGGGGGCSQGYGNPGGGGGGGHGSNGGNGGSGNNNGCDTAGFGGGAQGDVSLATFLFGGGGGSGGAQSNPTWYGGGGGSGGGIIVVFAHAVQIAGTITSTGQDGLTGQGGGHGSNGGGGAGGSLLFVYESGSAAANRFNVNGGAGGYYCCGSTQNGGNGGTGRLRLLQSAGIQNTGFEAADSAQSSRAQKWTGANLTKDKRTCNTISPPVTAAHTGNCAFLFKGGSGEKSKIVQKVNLGTSLLITGTPLTLSAWINSPANTVLAQVVAYHTDGTRIAFSVLMGPSAGYTRFVSAPFYLVKTTSKLKISFQHLGNSGKLYLDDVELIVSAAPSRASALPLPEPSMGAGWRSP